MSGRADKPSGSRHVELVVGPNKEVEKRGKEGKEGKEGKDIRLDHFLVASELTLSRSQLKRLIERGTILVNGKPSKAGARLAVGDRIDVDIPPPIEPSAIAQDIPLSIVYEDADLIVINKPSNMVVHPAPGHPNGTLVNALLYHCGDLSGIGGELRPGIVHRIDKDTTGLMVATKNDHAHQHLAIQFFKHTIDREYIAMVAPAPRLSQGKFDTLYGRHPRARKKFSSKVTRGKNAITHYIVEHRYQIMAATVRCWLETGRTHQIRVHFADAGSPLIGDPLYARKRHGQLGELASTLGRQALHAAVLGFEHPRDGRKLRFAAPLPRDLEELRTGLSQLNDTHD